MKIFLTLLDKKLVDLMNSPNMQKYNFPKSIAEIGHMPFKSHKELVNSIQNGNTYIVKGISPISDTVFGVMAKRVEQLLQYIYGLLPYLILILFFVFAIILHNYFLFIGIIFPFLAGLLTSKYFLLKNIKNIIPLLSFLFFIISLIFKQNTISFLTFGYLLNHLLLTQQRKLYFSVIYKRALELESAFIYLLVGNKIQVLDKNFKTYSNGQ